MKSNPPHITVCICTFKRPDLLRRCLEGVVEQRTQGLFTYSVVVSDNDSNRSAEEMAERIHSSAEIDIQYCCEPRQNIALARNCAVANSTGDYIAFIDDDEKPSDTWLVTLFKTITMYSVAGVLAPVLPYFGENAPQWVVQGGFYDRPSHPTGMQLEWRQCRTGNVLLRRELLVSDQAPFRPECLSGEDQDFFRRKMEEGSKFIWCHEAPVWEAVPPSRWKSGFLMRRAMFRGIFAQRNHGLQPIRLAQAVISVPLYLAVLPFAILFGKARFMLCMFKLSYHTGRLLALFGINPIRQQYVIE